MDTKEDIGDISLKQIIRKSAGASKDASVYLFSNHLTVECFEKAAKSAPKWLVDRWAIGQAPKQIARETGQPVEDIYRMLKDLERSIASDAGTDSHGKESVRSGSALAHKKDLQ